MVQSNENKKLEFNRSGNGRFYGWLYWLIPALFVAFASSFAEAQEEVKQVKEIKNADFSYTKCFEVGLDFERGIYLATTGSAELRYKQFARKVNDYMKENANDEETAEMADFLNKIGEYLPDYFQGNYEARAKINTEVGDDERKKEWLQVAVGGQATKTTKKEVSRVKAYQKLKVYDEKAVSEGYAQLNMQQPHEVKLLGLKLFTLDVNSAGATASDKITIYDRPNGKPQVKMKAGAKLWALDGTDGWTRVTYADEKGKLVWGYVLGPKVQKKVNNILDAPVPNRGKGREDL